MKHTKRILAMVMTVIMVLSLATTAFAANITIENGASGSEYAAYKLLNATDGGDDKIAYTLNGTYTTILQTVTGKSTEAEIIAYISGLNAEDARTFADDVYAKIVEGGITADYTADDNTFEGVAQGYYLIAETKVGDTTDTFSLVMLDTAGQSNITVKTKEDKPTVEKKVEEKNDTTGDTPTWGDSADYDLNDTINFKITGTVSSKYADYESYYYSFQDNMTDGLTLNPDSIKVMIGSVDVTTQFAKTTTDHSFTLSANLKELSGVSITGETEVIVTYTATLNENAVSGTDGNTNKVVLEYENNPYHEGAGDGNPITPDKPEKPGKTPEDTNVVFTYEVVIDKVDKDGNALPGAGFTLYKLDNGGNWNAVGTEITGSTTFEFKKLDEGKYKLVETTVPNGYNKADDVEFEIVSTLEGEALTGLLVKDAEGNVISEGEKPPFTVILADGKIKADVENQAGTELPETGGMGTTLFYAFGSVMVLCAVVLLVTKKRMAA